MENDLPFNSINNLIARKKPLAETLKTIVAQLAARETVALARIWLVERGDVCGVCPMRRECPDQTVCLHLTASDGFDLRREKDWTSNEGAFRRFPLGVRKVGVVAQSGEAVLLDEFELENNPWIVDREWIRREKIVSFAAHPLVFERDTLGVLAVFARRAMSRESFQWLGAYADQASIAIANARAFEELEKLRQRLEEENTYLREEVSETAPHRFLIGRSPLWQKILQQIEMVAATDATVLVTGESGTGKELVARAIHEASARRAKPLVKVNCAAISPELFESEFFGHVRGAFTGAFKDRAGRFQIADGGTIFLDEIGEVPLALQGKLLRVLQEKQFEKVGEDRTRTVDVRVIAATNRDLAAEVEKGNFRQDLFYRLTVFPVHLPPLRERIEDVAPLARHFLAKFAPNARGKNFALSEKDIETLESYRYPGNVRELENIIERAVIMGKCEFLNFSLPEIFDRIVVRQNEIAAIDAKKHAVEEDIKSYDEIKTLERENLVRALRRTRYKVYGADGAAALLGVRPTTLLSRIKAMNIAMRPE